MFTGLVEETAEVISFSEDKKVWKLKLRLKKVLGDYKIGDSLACNGCCLTAVEVGQDYAAFDLLEESVRLTSFIHYKPGDLVNVERSLLADARLGGHFVTGHVDATGIVDIFEQRGKDYYMHVRPKGKSLLRYLIYKGSIAVDGISLTVAEVDTEGFAVWLIPHTLAETNLKERQAGDVVNLEFDILGKYVERFTSADKK